MNTNNSKNLNSTSIPDFSKKIETPAPLPIIQKKFNNVPQQKKSDNNLLTVFYITLSILILITGYFVYNFADKFLYSEVPAKEQQLVIENSLVRATRSRVVSLQEGANKETVRNVIIQTLLYEKVDLGEISIIMPSYLRDTVVDGIRKLVSEPQRGDDFFFTFAVRAPLNLRAIAAQIYAIGVVGTKNGKEEFLAFSVSSAPDATREMLRYESEMYNDFRSILGLKEINGDLYFKDLSENNHIFRVAYDDDGVVMVYGFGAPKTIIVVKDVETFQNIYDSLK